MKNTINFLYKKCELLEFVINVTILKITAAFLFYRYYVSFYSVLSTI